MEAIRLNLGAGDRPLDGYINIDIKRGRPAYPLECAEGSIDEIRASHLLEHFSHRQVLDVLKNWVSKLKPGGILKIAVPDFGKIARSYVAGEKLNVLGYVMGGHVDQYDKHNSLFDESSLRQLMEAVELKDIRPWTSETQDAASLPISLNLMGSRDGQRMEETAVEVKIAAVISMPRLAFTDHLGRAVQIFMSLGIELTRGCGVFWGQVLTRLIEQHLDDGTEFLITTDYDTWFSDAHVRRLCQLIVEHPEADAIIPLQIMRENVGPMFGIRGADGQPQLIAERQAFEQPLTPVVTGHFGLTIFRMSAFQRLKRPWFMPQPGPDGSWNEGRMDEDIYFWNNFEASGLKAFLANEVSIGHLQLMCTLPGKKEDNWRPIHVYMTEVDRRNVPEHCIPKAEILK